MIKFICKLTDLDALKYIIMRCISCVSSPEFQYSCGRESGIWQVGSAATRAACSERINFLSRHKSAPPQYVPARFVFICTVIFMFEKMSLSIVTQKLQFE